MLFKETWFHHQIHKMQQYQTIHFIKLCLTLKNWRLRTVVLEKTRKSFGLQGEQTSQSKRKPTLNIHWKDWYWSWSSNTLATWWEKPTHWKRPCCLKRLEARGEGGHRGWDGWMASSAQWIWVWANSRRYRKTGKPGVLQSMESQRVEDDWVTEQQQPHTSVKFSGFFWTPPDSSHSSVLAFDWPVLDEQ